MKILAINCTPDLSYFTKRGLTFDVDYATLDTKFNFKYLYSTRDAQNNICTIYTPDVNDYFARTYTTYKYAFIIYAWNPADYPTNGTGGYTYPNALPCGTYWSTVRNNENVNSYILHELHHLLCDLLIFTMGKIGSVHDQMDLTWVNGVQMPYYKNGEPDAPDSNFAVTWNTISPFINDLQSIQYEGDTPLVTLTRSPDDGVQTLGTLQYASFTCKTLELAYKSNRTGISCIPKGLYRVKWTFSLRLLRYTYEVQGVPGRSGIRFHAGNFFFDLKGCIALGSGYSDINGDGKVDIINSRVVIRAFETLMNKKDFNLLIQ